MNKTIVSLLFCLVALTCNAGKVLLLWNSNPAHEQVTSYHLFERQNISITNVPPAPPTIVQTNIHRATIDPSTNIWPVTITNRLEGPELILTNGQQWFILTNVAKGATCFFMTASNRFGESGMSSNVCLIVIGEPELPEGVTIEQLGPDSASATLILTNVPSMAFIQWTDGDPQTGPWSRWLTLDQHIEDGLDAKRLKFSVYVDQPKRFWRAISP